MISYKTTIKEAKMVIILIIGITFLLAGLALLILPGPGILIIVLGLAVLATEFIWARRILKKLRSEGKSIIKRIR